jgi:hypothetical protein
VRPLNQVSNAIAADAAGNADVAGSNATGQDAEQSFVTKLDPNGNVLFSILLGGSAASVAQAIAVTSGGQILVSGTSVTPGFPSTAGAYSVPNTANHPFLAELSPGGTQTIFSATGIGGSAIALDFLREHLPGGNHQSARPSDDARRLPNDVSSFY